MQVNVDWSPQVSARFSNLAVCIGAIHNVRIEKNNKQLHQLKETVYGEVKAKYDVETLKDNPIIRAYRDFYWQLNVDPTKTRPSGEALLRRVLHNSDIPNINTAVDAYNLASLKTIVPISGFDKDKIRPPLQVRFALNDSFSGIGMSKPVLLEEKMLVMADANQVLCVYPYRDADATKITETTRNVLIAGYGVPEVAESILREAVETALNYIKRVAQGEIETVKVFSCKPE
ncbi:MAG: phenylalanine--tRNA ligase beta subunit-related protein [Candidatus Bathyarchaeia archaeon]